MPRPHKVEELLSREELDELEAFCREPGRSVDEVHQWLLERGFTLSRSSAGRWKASFDEDAMHDRVRQSIEASARYAEVAKEAGVAGMASASLARFQQLMFETLVRSDEADAGELMKLSIALKTAVQGGRQIEVLRKEYETRQREAVEAAEKTSKAGGDSTAVVNKVREILGIKG